MKPSNNVIQNNDANDRNDIIILHNTTDNITNSEDGNNNNNNVKDSINEVHHVHFSIDESDDIKSSHISTRFEDVDNLVGTVSNVVNNHNNGNTHRNISQNNNQNNDTNNLKDQFVIDNITNINNLEDEIDIDNIDEQISNSFPTIEVIKNVQQNRKKRQFSTNTVEDEEMSRLEFQQWTSRFLNEDVIDIDIDDVEAYEFPQTTAAHFTDVVDDPQQNAQIYQNSLQTQQNSNKKISDKKVQRKKQRLSQSLSKSDNSVNNATTNDDKLSDVNNKSSINDKLKNEVHSKNRNDNNSNDSATVKIVVNNNDNNNTSSNNITNTDGTSVINNVSTNGNSSVITHIAEVENTFGEHEILTPFNTLEYLKNRTIEQNSVNTSENNLTSTELIDNSVVDVDVAVEEVNRAVNQAVAAVQAGVNNEDIEGNESRSNSDAIAIAAAVVAAEKTVRKQLESSKLNNLTNDVKNKGSKKLNKNIKESTDNLDIDDIGTQKGINKKNNINTNNTNTNKTKNNKSKNKNNVNNEKKNANDNILVESKNKNIKNENISNLKNSSIISDKLLNISGAENALNKLRINESIEKITLENNKINEAINKAKLVIKKEIRTGRSFNNEEIQAINIFVTEYRNIHNMTKEMFVHRIWGNERRKDRFWENLQQVLPERTRSSLYKHVRRTYHIFEKRGVWTNEEDTKLSLLAKKYEAKWKLIGEEMKRMPEDCRDRWRNYVKCGNNRNVNKWTLEEENKLKHIISEILDKERDKILNGEKKVDDEIEGEMNIEENKKRNNKQISDALVSPTINWTMVSEMMGGTRSRIQCRYKWNKIMKMESIQKLREMDQETKIWMLEKIKELGERDPHIEANLDWNALALNVPEEMCKVKQAPWNGVDLCTCFERLRATIDWRGQGFVQLVETLIGTLSAASYVERIEHGVGDGGGACGGGGGDGTDIAG